METFLRYKLLIDFCFTSEAEKLPYMHGTQPNEFIQNQFRGETLIDTAKNKQIKASKQKKIMSSYIPEKEPLQTISIKDSEQF